MAGMEDSIQALEVKIVHLELRVAAMQGELGGELREMHSELGKLRSWVIAAVVLGFGTQVAFVIHGLSW